MDDLVDPRDSALVASLLVRAIKRKLGGSLEEVARELGLSVKTLHRWEAGTHGASPKHLALLARKAGHPLTLVQGVVRQLGLLRGRPEGRGDAGAFRQGQGGDGAGAAEVINSARRCGRNASVAGGASAQAGGAFAP